MEGPEYRDPFEWDVGTVAEELCSLERPCAHNVASLRQNVHEQQIDGHTLLTFEYVCSRPELFEALDIKIGRHKAALGHAILRLRAQSPLFREWRIKSLGELGELDGAVPPTLNRPLEAPRADISRRTEIVVPVHMPSNKRKRADFETRDEDTKRRHGIPDIEPTELASGQYDASNNECENGTAQASDISTVGGRLEDTLQNVAGPETSEASEPRLANSALSDTANSSISTVLPNNHNAATEHLSSVSSQANGNAEKHLKRKRVAPKHISAPTGQPSTFESSFGVPPLSLENIDSDGFPLPKDDFPWEKALPHSYLGDSILSYSAIRSPDGTLTRQVHDNPDVIGSFHITVPSTSPPGWRLVVNNVMKRFFKKNSRFESLLSRGEVPMRSPSTEEEDDSVDVFDLPETWDDETLEAIERDKIEEQEESTKRIIPKERVQALLQEAVDAFKKNWEETKLPKHQRKAYYKWTSALKQGTRGQQILNARHRAQVCDRRLKKEQRDILAVPWEKEADVIRQAQISDQNLADKLYNQWLAQMLESRVEPAKPARIQNANARPVARRLVYDDTEVLSSSEEDDFIVNDEEDVPVGGDNSLSMDMDMDMDIDTPPVDNEGEMEYQLDVEDGPKEWPDVESIVDLTCLESSPEASPKRDRAATIIDLTTPIKPKSESRLTSSTPGPISKALPTEQTSPELQKESWDIVEISRHGPIHWVKAKDGPRLAIALLWRLGHERRAAIMDASREHDAEGLFHISIGRHLAQPAENKVVLQTPGPATMAFDMTHIFLGFLKAQNYSPSRILKISSKKVKLIRRSVEEWDKFHAFLNEIADGFPLDSQIYRTDALDELDDVDGSDIDDDALSDDQAPMSQARKNAPREIVQSREALDLREREKRRLEEQELRRIKLRATLDAHDIMSQDKSRLIINEAKQDDQAFVYINKEAGERIKDHQIDGVRFLWNQSTIDASTRQGCLLSHTMGLGKTMQVITFLVAIQESAHSPDPAVSSQIPEDLTASKTLVICPAGLVDNWLDEFLIWVPDGSQLLGPIRKIAADMDFYDREQTVQSWSDEGGVLIIGYNLFKKIVKDREDHALLQVPSIVVADEAHVLKSPKTAAHQVCTRFRTNCRIALTGSPLANNVKEYYFMINWVAPLYLGDYTEFRQIYEDPIQHGFWGDSTKLQKRRALKMLRVLSETVAPKVHRRNIQCLRGDLPVKQEFILCVPLGELQESLYKLYIEFIREQGTSPHLVALEHLRLLCNHPRCFREKALHDRKARQGLQGQQGGVEGLAPKENTMSEAIVSAILKQTKMPDIDDASLSIKAQLLIMILDEARLLQDKVLVFSQSIPTLDYLTYLLQMQRRRICRLDGSTTIGKRQEMVKKFNEGDKEVYLISTTAGGVGLNIQGANRVVIFDFGWNPVHDQQAVGRAYRLGQEKPVFVYQFVVAGSFEEHLHNKAVYKTQLAARVVDKQNPVSFSKQHLGQLLQFPTRVEAKPLDGFVGRDQILDKLIKFKKDGEAIRWIVSTDTFEEEDLTDKLTAEERQEAEEIGQLNRLRLSDPAEYERRMKDERISQLMQRIKAEERRAMPTVPAAQTVAPGWNEDVPLPFATGTTDVAMTNVAMTNVATTNVAATVTAHTVQTAESGLFLADAVASGTAIAATTESEPVPSPTMTTLPTAPPTVPTVLGAVESHAKAPSPAAVTESQGDGQDNVNPLAAAPVPVAGTNTYFGERITPEAAPWTPKPRPLFVSNASPANPFLPSRSLGKDQFEKALLERLEELQQESIPGVGGDRECIVKGIVGTIDTVRRDGNFGTIPDLAHWNLLKELVKNRVFALATISGRFSASFLALGHKDEMEKRIAALEKQLQEGVQLDLVAGFKTRDPGNLRNLSRLPLTQASPRAREDERVMREAADRRRQRSAQPEAQSPLSKTPLSKALSHGAATEEKVN